ncbi:DNA polymerase Y family protein [Zavarzinella formosa]|uniref:DNA polymerase Y family protein n=1 Tax=Zavarzinella formosa TaxID=360055 RepID=UPI0002E2A30C|nr:hypothetical protein [Zavarzinella formosa]
MRFVAHLDADCYYVSADRVRYPDLIGKPVGVVGNQGACVIAKSYELKAQGVKTGEPVWDVLKKCPETIFVKRDFRWYEVLSRRMLAMVRERSEAAEFYSIDEFFFSTDADKQIARGIQNDILNNIGLPVTIGVARSRTLAKLFSDTAKPLGIRVVTDPDEEREHLAKLPVGEVSGIGHRRAAKLLLHGIRTCLDYANAERRLIRGLLTKTGEDLWWELRGQPVTPIRPDRPTHKFLSRGGSIGGASADPNVIRAWLVRNSERLVEELEHYDLKAGTLSLSLSDQYGGGDSINAPLPGHTNRYGPIIAALLRSFERCWQPGTVITHMHLVAGDLKRPGFVQRTLFDPPDDETEPLAVVKRDVNERHGRFAVRGGTTLFIPEMYRDRSHGYEICDVRGKFCF